MNRVILLSIMVHVASVSFSQSRKADTIRHVSVVEFKQVMDSLQKEVVVDLRTPEEIKNHGKIAEAIEVDFFGPNFEPALARLDKNKVYLIYCASGGRSGETAEIMQKMGFKTIYELREGFNVWVRKKMPVQK